MSWRVFISAFLSQKDQLFANQTNQNCVNKRVTGGPDSAGSKGTFEKKNEILGGLISNNDLLRRYLELFPPIPCQKTIGVVILLKHTDM